MLEHEYLASPCIPQGALWEISSFQIWGTHHTLVPDDGHPLLCAVGPLGDEGEVVFAHGSLRGVEGAVGAARHLEVTTGDRRNSELYYII